MDKYNESYPLMVSIKCLAYNHEKFIRETLDGFVMQKTNFRFEAIVHDDASTDGTAEIIREYAEKYPDIIKPIYEIENQYSKKDGSLSRIMHEACKGKYIAMCEGDDYWTDPYKLQKQVDFLEANPDYVICSHRYKIFDENLGDFSPDISPKIENKSNYSLSDLIDGLWLTQPLTVVYKSSALNFTGYMKCKVHIDVVLFYFLLKNGKGYLLPDIMAVYRVHSNSVWAPLPDQNKYINEIKHRLSIYDVEKTKDSVDLIYNIIKDRPLSRKMMIVNWSLFFRVFAAIIKYKGLLRSMELFGRFINIRRKK